MSLSPTSSLLPRALAVACIVLLLAVATLLAQIGGLRAEIASMATLKALAEQEHRDLRQQLEAERLFAAAQSRLLRAALPASSAPPTRPTTTQP